MNQALRLCLILAFVISIFSGCFSDRTQDAGIFGQSLEETTQSGENGIGISGWGPHMVTGGIDIHTDPEGQMLDQILAALENEDAASLKCLFSVNTRNACESLEEQIVLLNQFFDGEVESVASKGSISHAIKDGETKLRETQASYDIATTSEGNRIAFSFCAMDATDPDNVGLQSFYIIKAEDSDMDFSYWGEHKWEAGMFMEGNSGSEFVDKE